MKNISIILIFSSFLLLLGCSKDDFFELERPPQDPWLTLSELERAPIGAYATLFSGTLWGVPLVDNAMVKAQMGDDIGAAIEFRFGYLRNTEDIIEFTDRPWQAFYRAIAGANDALRFIEDNNGYPFEGLSAVDSMNIRRIKGELLFVRGYAYFLLQTTFGHAYVPGGSNSTPDIPLITRFASSAEEAFSPKIGTTEEIFNQVLSDFTAAKELLPRQFDGMTMPAAYEVRANKFAAAAMLAKTYFQMGGDANYSKALDELNFVIDQNDGAYDLSEDPIEAWNKSSVDRGREVIFYVPYFDQTLEYPEYYSVINHTLRGAGLCGYSQGRMSDEVITRLGWMDNPGTEDTTMNVAARADKRFTQLFERRYPVAIAYFDDNLEYDPREELWSITTIFPNKYYRGPSGPHTNIPYIRLAEMYLTRSILRLRKGDVIGAVEDLNVVRQRAWNENIGGSFVPVTTDQITEDMIHDERIVEMFAENDRIDYLRALKLPIGPGERTDASGNPLPDEPYTSEKFIWAKPLHETIYNLEIP